MIFLLSMVWASVLLLSSSALAAECLMKPVPRPEDEGWKIEEPGLVAQQDCLNFMLLKAMIQGSTLKEKGGIEIHFNLDKKTKQKCLVVEKIPVGDDQIAELQSFNYHPQLVDENTSLYQVATYDPVLKSKKDLLKDLRGQKYQLIVKKYLSVKCD